MITLREWSHRGRMVTLTGGMATLRREAVTVRGEMVTQRGHTIRSKFTKICLQFRAVFVVGKFKSSIS